MRNFLFLVFCFLFLVSCQSNQNQIPVVGSLDSSAIAIDTLMQKGFESSYEFHKTLIVHEKLVYDVVGYGGSASQGEFAIIRRGADNKADTVLKGKRNGIITNAQVQDLNRNKRAEIYLVIKSSENNYGDLMCFEENKSGELTDVPLIPFSGSTKKSGVYLGGDSIWLNDAFILNRTFHLYKKQDKDCCPTGDEVFEVYEHAKREKP